MIEIKSVDLYELLVFLSALSKEGLKPEEADDLKLIMAARGISQEQYKADLDTFLDALVSIEGH